MAVNKLRDIKGQNEGDTKQANLRCVCIDIGRRGGTCMCPSQSAKPASKSMQIGIKSNISERKS